MNSQIAFQLRLLATACALVAGISSTPASAASWINNGASACKQILTPDVVASLLKNPHGQFKTVSPQSCSYGTDAGTITILLKLAPKQAFDAFMKYLPDPQPLPGVGDKAVSTMLGITAYKAPDLGCDIDVGGPGFKISGAERNKKLGAICNKLFGMH